MSSLQDGKKFQKTFWLSLVLGLVLAVWLLKPILLPFVAASVLAYFLNPAVEWLESWRAPRWAGTSLVLSAFVVAVIILLLLISPLIQSQVAALLQALPDYIQAARDKMTPLIEGWAAHLSPAEVEKLRDAAGTYAGSAVGWAGEFIRSAVIKGFALFDALMLLVITPIVAFYLLRDWPKATKQLDALVPRAQHGLVQHAMQDIDRTLAGFLRGQALVCLALGVVYGVGLTLTGLNYGATIGIIAGVLSFIPYVGSGFVLIVSMLLAFVQFDDLYSIGLVFSVFLVGQTLESYVLTPKLVGDRVGLHPVWILFALFAGGSLLGFAGILIAVPVAAVIGVLIRIAIKAYKESPLYQGPTGGKQA